MHIAAAAKAMAVLEELEETGTLWLLTGREAALLLDELGYDGWIGCEYRPRAGDALASRRGGERAGARGGNRSRSWVGRADNVLGLSQFPSC